MVFFTIIGEPASKANSRVPIPRTSKAGNAYIQFAKSAKALAYFKAVQKQVPVLRPMLEGPLVAHITIWYASERPDLDESIILDALQKRVYKNDRQIREKHIYRRLDRANPRADVRIEAKGL